MWGVPVAVVFVVSAFLLFVSNTEKKQTGNLQSLAQSPSDSVHNRMEEAVGCR